MYISITEELFVLLSFNDTTLSRTPLFQELTILCRSLEAVCDGMREFHVKLALVCKTHSPDGISSTLTLFVPNELRKCFWNEIHRNIVVFLATKNFYRLYFSQRQSLHCSSFITWGKVENCKGHKRDKWKLNRKGFK